MRNMTSTVPERRLALIHRVIVPDQEHPKEYAILVTDRRSIFIRQKKTRGNFWLRREISYGTALITDLIPKTLEDYQQTSVESLTADSTNIMVHHEAVISLAMKKEEQQPRKYDFFVRLTMRMQREEFQVYDFEMNYRESPNSETMIKFYMVPLGAYFKPRRQTQTRETILREYATDALEIFQKVLPAKIVAY
ncbi:hypothetical protein E6H20_03420 [Candidatus Bathyarchaeota archaeon]|nr:MAG: hypothetical protein E6H20_03420 [Candidatus Bathyarchaeota archaeon]